MNVIRSIQTYAVVTRSMQTHATTHIHTHGENINHCYQRVYNMVVSLRLLHPSMRMLWWLGFLANTIVCVYCNHTDLSSLQYIFESSFLTVKVLVYIIIWAIVWCHHFNSIIPFVSTIRLRPYYSTSLKEFADDIGNVCYF